VVSPFLMILPERGVSLLVAAFQEKVRGCDQARRATARFLSKRLFINVNFL